MTSKPVTPCGAYVTRISRFIIYLFIFLSDKISRRTLKSSRMRRVQLFVTVSRNFIIFMEPFNAKLVAAATGSTLTALTSTFTSSSTTFANLFPVTPFDVVKTRLQTQPGRGPSSPRTGALCCQPNNLPCVRNMSSLARTQSSLAHQVVCVWENGVFKATRVNGFFDAIKQVLYAEGVKGLWKGAGTTLWVSPVVYCSVDFNIAHRIIGVPSSTTYMLLYDHLLRQTLPPLLPASIVPLSAGMLARTTITSFASPLELIRTNLQSTPTNPSKPNTLSSVLRSINGLVRDQGVRSLWRGLGPSLWRDVPFSGIYWASYESIKTGLHQQGFGRKGHGADVAFVSGAVSGTAAALLTSPFDVLKTRQQSFVMKAQSGPMSSFGLLVGIVRNEGAGALFTGILPRMAKIAPACGIMIASFEVSILVRRISVCC